jgi:hypothetical protein
MRQGQLIKEGQAYFVELGPNARKLTTFGGLRGLFRPNIFYNIRKPRKGMDSQITEKNAVVLGSYIVNKRELYDFLFNEGEEVISGPGGNRSNGQYTDSI